MGFWSRLLGRRSAAGKATLRDPAWLADVWAPRSASGAVVTPDSAMRAVAVFACVRLLSETIGTIPLHLYRRRPDGGKELAKDHPLYSVLHDLPNPLMTAVELREALQASLVLRGNAYCRIIRDGAGRITELIPLHPDRVRVEASKTGRSLVYVVDGHDRFLSGDIWHIRGFTLDGVMGVSPVTYARETIGLALTAEQHGAAFMGNGARPGGVLVHPDKLDDEARLNLKASWQAAHGGGNVGTVAVLEEGLKFEAITVSAEDMQYIETRKFQRSEIAALFRVPPHMVGDLERATFSNIEQQGLEFKTYSIRPWAVRWEASIVRDLLLPSERAEFYPLFNLEGLHRGDMKSRFEAYKVGITNGILSSNECRELEDRNPRPGGDTFLQPLNMAESKDSGEDDAESIQRAA